MSQLRLIGFFLAVVLSCPLFSAPAKAQAVKGVESARVAVDGGEVYYERKGRGRALVMIHGGQMDRRMWDPQFDSYSKRFLVIRYDVRSYGKSTQPANPYWNTRDLYTLLRHLRVQKAVLIGLSLGGRIAIDFAIEHPEMVNGLVLAGPGLSGFQFTGAGQEESIQRITEAVKQRDGRKAAEMWLKDPYMIPAMENGAISQKVREITLDNGATWLADSRLDRELEPPAFGRLQEVKAPTVIIVGDRDVADIQAIVTKLKEGIRGAKARVIKGAGHIVNMEKPREFDRLVLSFLKRVS